MLCERKEVLVWKSNIGFEGLFSHISTPLVLAKATLECLCFFSSSHN